MEHVTVELVWKSIPFSVTLSSKINTAWVDMISAVGSPMTKAVGESIIELEEKNVDQGFLVMSGSFSVQKDGAPEIVKEGPELLGEMSRFNPLHKRTARVRAVTPISMIAFSWEEVFLGLNEGLTPEEVEQLNHAFEQYAWEHFTEV